jgi:hypothetical protein
MYRNMASPNFAFTEPTPAGFTAVNERFSPSVGVRPLDSPTPRNAWSHTNGNSVGENASSPQTSLPLKRRFGEVDHGNEDHTVGMNSPSNPNGPNGVYPPLNGDSQPGAVRDGTWTGGGGGGGVDDSRMAQMLQAESQRTEDHSLGDGGPGTASPASDGPNGTDHAMVTTKAGLQYDQKKRKRVSRM